MALTDFMIQRIKMEPTIQKFFLILLKFLSQIFLLLAIHHLIEH